MGIMDTVKSVGDLKKMRDEAMKMQKILAQKETVVEEDGVRIVMTGDMQVKEFSIQGISNPLVVAKLNKAVRITQELVAKEFASQNGGLSNLLSGMK
jgi:DNA-binding protein YbaB